MSFVVNCDVEYVNNVFSSLEKFQELELHGIHNGYQIVAVADMPSTQMEALLAQVNSIEHVQTCEVSFVNVEDEIEE